MTSVWYAYLHWTVGRAAIVFAWVNMVRSRAEAQNESKSCCVALISASGQFDCDAVQH